MSIKRYLFLLIGGIVIGVALIQLMLIHLFKSHLSEEIVQKSRQLSTEIVEFAFKNVNLDDNAFVVMSDGNEKETKEAKILIDRFTKVHELPDDDCQVINKRSRDDKGHVQIMQIDCTTDNDKTTDTLDTDSAEMTNQQSISAQALREQQKLWKKQLHKIIEQRHEGQEVISEFTFVSDTPKILRHQSASKIHSSNAVDTLVDYMIYLIIASAVVALVLALWLSNHFTLPLQRLAHGFNSLEKGDFGAQVAETGISEYRKTICQFNHMSRQLAMLAEAETKLQQQSHLVELGEVSRGLAHALRNPMHTIGLAVEQLKDSELPEKVRNRLQERILAKIKHVDKTIKALLTLTSAEIQRDDEVPVKSVLLDIVLEMKANDPDVQLIVKEQNKAVPDSSKKQNGAVPNSLYQLTGAESEIRAIIHTLVVNAVEANHNRGEILIELIEDSHKLTVKVTDRGDGLNPSIEETLFQPHVSSKAEGAGMGLYIARRLVTLYYHGDIQLVNHPDGGCIATVEFMKGNDNE